MRDGCGVSIIYINSSHEMRAKQKQLEEIIERAKELDRELDKVKESEIKSLAERRPYVQHQIRDTLR